MGLLWLPSERSGSPAPIFALATFALATLALATLALTTFACGVGPELRVIAR